MGPADASPDALNNAPMGPHAAQCADLHGDERVSTKPDHTVPLSEAPKGVAVVAKGGTKPSAEATMVSSF